LQVLAVIVVVLILLIGLFVYEGVRARNDLEAARHDAHTLQHQLTDADFDAATKTTTTLRDHTAHARSNTSGWLWSAATHLPLIGDDIDAVRTIAASLDTVAQQALPTVIDLSHRVEDGALQPRGGRLPLDAIGDLAPSVQRAADVVDGPADHVAALHPGHLFGSLSSAVRQAQDQISETRSTLDTLARTFKALPAAAGQDGPRDYLLLFQNNAEVRASGGIAGAWAVMHAAHGRLSISRQGTGAALDADPPRTPPLRITKAERLLYGSEYGTELRDANFTPDFPRYAQLADALVSRVTGVDFDGVFSVDPVALSYLLRGTGPVQVGPTTLTAANATRLLLNQVYFDYTPAGQDRFFARAAQAIFTAVAAGQGKPVTVIKALAQGVAERRILAWSDEPALDAAIGHTAIAGLLTAPSGPPQVGIFVDDATATKLEYYLDMSTTLARATCDGDDETVVVTTRLHSRVPKSAHLPASVTGPAKFAPEGTMVLNARIFSPAGGAVSKLSLDGEKETVAGGAWGARQAVILPVQIAPGQTRRLTTTLTLRKAGSGAIRLTTTPGMHSGDNPVTVGSC